MKKYIETVSVDSTKNIPFYKTNIPNSPPVEQVPFYYTTRQAERLDNISARFYRNPQNWWVIAKANNLATGIISVPGGTKLFIPNL